MTEQKPFPALNRRDTLRLIGAAGLAAAAAPVAQAQSSQAQSNQAPSSQAAPAAQTGTLNGNGFYRQKIGEMTLTLVSDGTAPLAAVLPTWGKNEDMQAQFAATLAEYSVAATNTVNHFNPVVIDTGKNRVLIDTGRGGEAGQLQANLRRAGIAVESIDTVFITHGHGDHIAGLTQGGKPTFSRARHVMGRADFTYWTTQAQPNDAVKNNLIALKDQFTLLDDGAEIVPGLSALLTPGHTPGHMSVQAVSGNEKLMVFGDAAGHFLLSLKHPGAYLGFDTDGPQAAATRARIFPMAAAEKMWVTGYHFPFHGIGHLRALKEGGYEYEPVVWQWS
ncbi:MBL fold metallo-hydrolase [Deinococcus cavernae]|uniref:MBL fold metallo-hydrolase n=1 Tax=Deinococcus cavernae TaxID=2320857 RepID=A0A418V9Y8_9DEIO|nr:MBL fold metallo-hydrolase [Deinococcus cavernae]RJF72877.1 MBL fold metallo-hydrolase [Deinococcus cavernae]